MQMTLADLRNGTLEWLNDPLGDLFTPNQSYVRMNRLINESYQELVNEAGLTPQPLAVCVDADAVTVTTDAAIRDYPLVPATGKIAKVLQVFEDLGSFQREEVPLVPWTQRQSAAGGLYVFRSRGGSWFLGLVAMPPAYTTLKVFFRATIQPLTDGSHVPVELPDEHHELIIYLTAMRALIQEDRDASKVAALYGDALQRMKRSLGYLDGGLKAVRF